MQIIHTLLNIETREIRDVTVDDMVSPTGGYTQSYADRQGEDYAAHRAPEMLGGRWTHLGSEYMNTRG